MNCPPDSPCPLEGRVVKLEAQLAAHERVWAITEGDVAARLAALAPLLPLAELVPILPVMEAAAREAMAALERPAPAQGQPPGECPICHHDNAWGWLGYWRCACGYSPAQGQPRSCDNCGRGPLTACPHGYAGSKECPFWQPRDVVEVPRTQWEDAQPPGATHYDSPRRSRLGTFQPAPASGRPCLHAGGSECDRELMGGECDGTVERCTVYEPAPAQGQPLCECGHPRPWHLRDGQRDVCFADGCQCVGWQPREGGR